MSSVDDYLNQSAFVAQSATVGSLDDDPDQAAQALDLESETGVPATAIYGDLDGFNRQYKAHLASGIISDNQFISDWLSSHPMAPKVAHDDLGQLDEVSRNLQDLPAQSQLQRWLKSDSIARSFMEGWGDQPLGSSVFQRPSDVEWALAHPVMASIGAAAATPGEAMSRAVGGMVHLGHDGLAQVFGESFANEAAAMAEWAMMRGDIRVHAEGGPLVRAAQNKKLLDNMTSVARGLQLADPWTRAGVEPPAGLHPLIDEAKKLQSKEDIDALDQALAEAAKSATRERSPELFANFIRSHIGQREIGIDPEAVRELYGDRVPSSDDNILGWVPDLDSRLASAELTGGDVRVPLADWLANVDPDVAKQLHDDIRVRDGGLTINEGKIEAEPKEVGPEHLQQIRGAAGLEPLAQAGDRNVLLKQKLRDPAKPLQPWEEGMHDVDILDENGKPIGTINLSEQQGGKQLYIEMIQAGAKENGFYQPNFLGPSLVKSIKAQLKQMFPNAESITGHRVSGAREKAGSYLAESASPVVKLRIGEHLDDPEAFRQLLQNYWQPIGRSGLQALFGTPEEGLAMDSPMGRLVAQELKRLAPQTPAVVAKAIDYKGTIHGAYLPELRSIITALTGSDPIGTAKHESIHALRAMGLFTNAEWAKLEDAARAQDWIGKYEVEKRWGDLALGDRAKLEESIAEAFVDWSNGRLKVEDPTVFQRIKDFIDAILQHAGRLLGIDNPTWEDVFRAVDAGEVGAREGRAEGLQKELADSFVQAQKPTEEEGFGIYDRAKALGVTQAHMDRMLSLIDKRNAEDFEASKRRAETRQRRRITKEWKERRTVLRDDVRGELGQRPDIAIDQLFAKQKIKFDPAYLTQDQQARLPKDYLQKKDGVNPDDLAPYFGYTSGDALVERLGMLAEDRRRSGMSPRDYLNRLIDVETDRRLNQEFGDREQTVLDEAKDQALSETQLQLVHEETLAYALKAGQEPQFTKEQVREMVKGEFDRQPVGSIKSMQFLQAAGKIGKKIEEAGSKGDWAEAYRLSQQRNHAVLYAKFARDYEKQRAQFDRVAKQFRKREVASVPAEYTNWVHDILQRTGNPINRSIQDLEENIGRQSEGTLRDFVEAKEAEWMGLRELPVADFLLDPTFRKPVDELSHSDFMGLKMSIDALVKAGRDERKIIHEGEAWDREQALGEMREKLASFGYKPSKAEPGPIGKWPRAFIYGLTNMETLLNRWDRGDPRGIFQRLVMRPLAEAANSKARLQREVAGMYKELSRPKDLDKLVSAPFADPLTRTRLDPEGSGPWDGFRRSHVLQMLNNAGNESNWKVLARGYGADPAQLFDWLQRNVTREDIERAEGLGRIFKKLIGKSDGVYERMTGATVEKIPLKPIEFKLVDGTTYQSQGWYHPLIEDPVRKTVWVQDPDTGLWSQKAQGKRDTINDSDFFHFATANGYTKRRTGAIYPVDLDFNMTPTRINQMIHDISFREVVHETQKVFSDRRFQEDVAKYYGREYSKGMMPYLRAVAGAAGINSEALGMGAKLSELLRQNVISTYIGFNPFTVLKHGPTAAVMSSREVGLRNFAEAVKTLYGQAPSVAKLTHDFIMENSEEIQRRERNWQDTIAGQGREITGAGNLREKIIQAGSAAVAWSDMVSAKPTWLAAYNKALGDGLSHGESISLADRAVRRAHGSTAETNQPPLVQQSGTLHGWLTSVYGFFGTAMQRRIETAQKLNDAWQLGMDRQIGAAGKKLGSAFADFMTYMVWPTIVEEAVSGLSTDDHRTWGSRIISGATMGMASSVLYLRDLIHGAVSGHEPGVGLLSSALHDVNEAIRDVSRGRGALSRQHAAKTVGDLLTVTGEATGMVPKTVANVARYATSVQQGQERPRSIADVLLGATRGTQKRRVEK